MYFINSMCEVKTFIREDQSRWISFLDLDTDETIQLRFPRGLLVYYLTTAQQLVFRYHQHDGKWITRSIKIPTITHILEIYTLYVKYIKQVYSTTSYLIDIDAQRNCAQSLVHDGPTPLFVSYGTSDVSGYCPLDKITTYLCKRNDPNVQSIAKRYSESTIKRMLKHKVTCRNVLSSKCHYKGDSTCSG